MDYIITWYQSGYCFPAKPWELVFNKVIAVVYISTNIQYKYISQIIFIFKLIRLISSVLLCCCCC